MYDLIIIGAGPGGTAAGVYAARKRLKTLLLTGEFGGQSVVSEDIQNWISFPSISGPALAESFKKHLEATKGDVLEVKEGVYVSSVEQQEEHFKVTTSTGVSYETRSVLLTTGSHRRKLEVPGAKEFDNKGISYCASCDGPLFAGKDVAVIGGGNAGFETAAQLLAYCKTVTLLHKNPTYKADEVTVAKVLAHPNMRSLPNVDLVSIQGDTFVSGLTYRDKTTGEEKQIAVEAIFAEVGNVPTTDMVKNLVTLNDFGYVVVDSKTQRASLPDGKAGVPGIWAAGDCTDGLYHQNNIAAGDAVKALEDLYLWLKTR